MAKSKIFNNNETKIKILDGIIENAEIVAKTFGYNGKDVLINIDGNNIITNDGVFVSNNIYFDDELKDIGSSFIRNITLNSDLSSGDGTTTSAILTMAMAKQLKNLLKNKDIDMLEVKKGMLKAQEEVNELIKMYKQKLSKKDYFNVAYTVTRNDEIATLVTTIFEKIGSKGKVLFKESDAQGISVEYQSGFTFDYGYNTTMLPNILNDSAVVLYKERINSVPILQEIVKSALANECKALTIIVREGVADIVMQTAIAIQQSKDLNIDLNIIRVSGTEKKVNRLLKDISTITSAKIIDDTFTYETHDFLGFAKKVSIDDKQTTLIDGNTNKKELKKVITTLTKKMNDTRSEIEKDELRERIGNLEGLVGIISIGALSREKISNYKDKIKDVVNSLRNAIDDGVIPGGGATLIRLYSTITRGGKNQTRSWIIGHTIVLDSLLKPLETILDNSHVGKNKKEEIIDALCMLNNDELNGYDARNGEICPMLENGIIDPYKTIVNSFNNAVEITSMVAALDCAIVTKSEVFENERA